MHRFKRPNAATLIVAVTTTFALFGLLIAGSRTSTAQAASWHRCNVRTAYAWHGYVGLRTNRLRVRSPMNCASGR
jgi:hypothetical protein